MAKPTRKQPERRKSAPRKPGSTARPTSARGKAPSKIRANIVIRAACGLGRLTLRNPAIFGGGAAFAIVFGFVAANALWYQPGHHPSPLLRTRLPFTHPDPARVSLNEPQSAVEPGKVTTFVIKREDELADADPDAVAAETLPTPERTASVPHGAASPPAGDLSAPQLAAVAAPEMQPADLVAAVQAELLLRGVYDGDPDGRLGPKTTTAIKRFEASAGRPQTGIASADLLRALQGTEAASGPGGATAIRPAPRPTAVSQTAAGVDPVAAAIRAAEGAPAPVKPPIHLTKPVETAAAQTDASVVMSIQRGLINLAYTDVTIDGVAGDQTRAAIRHFEKHYRLPETGQPSATVLRKMKEIGAL